jgi:hypothetical protein
MYARVPTFNMSAENIDAAILHFENVTVPGLRKLPGFKGATLLVSREKGMAEKFGAELVSLEEFEVAVEV